MSFNIWSTLLFIICSLFLQVQDSPDSFFSLDINDYITGDEVSSTIVMEVPKPVIVGLKSQLQSLQSLLSHDIFDLVQDAQQIRDALKVIKHRLSPELESIITPATYIAGHQPKIFQPKKHLKNRQIREPFRFQRDIDQQVSFILKKEVGDLITAPTHINSEIIFLKAKEQQLLKESEDIWSAIAQKEKILVGLLDTIKKTKEDLAIKIHDFIVSFSQFPGLLK